MMYDEEKIIDIEDFHKEKSFKEKAKEKWYFFKREVKDLAVNRPEIVTAVILGTAVVGKEVFKYKANSRRYKAAAIEKEMLDRQFYDRKLMMRVTARRALKPHELVELSRRYNNGENYVEILSSMNLL